MLFSVTIPAYKTAYLKEAINSVIAQTYPDFELIIVDDCSPNDIESIVNEFNDKRIRYYRNEKNCGAIDVVDNWNICLSYSKGEYIICMGDDDRLLPNCLEEYAKLIKKHPNIGLLHGWTEIINENSEIINITPKRCSYESALSLIWHRWNVYSQQFIGDFCFKIDNLRDNGGFYKLPLAWASDDISAVIAASKNGVLNTEVLVFQYRVSGATITNSGNYHIKMQSIMLEERWFYCFLSDAHNIAENDLLYYRLLTQQIRKHFSSKRIHTISSDMQISKLHLIYWLKNRTKYNLSIYSIIKAFLISLYKSLSQYRILG